MAQVDWSPLMHVMYCLLRSQAAIAWSFLVLPFKRCLINERGWHISSHGSNIMQRIVHPRDGFVPVELTFPRDGFVPVELAF